MGIAKIRKCVVDGSSHSWLVIAGASFTKAPIVIGGLVNAVDISTMGETAITIVTLRILGLTLLTSLIDRSFAAYVMELERKNEELARTSAQALEAVGAKSEFLATMSHEIRNAKKMDNMI